MKDHRGGAIVLTSSGSIKVSGLGGGSGRGGPAYVTSKAAINGLNLALARALGRYNIRDNTFSPGATETPMIADYTADSRAPAAGRSFLGRNLFPGACGVDGGEVTERVQATEPRDCLLDRIPALIERGNIDLERQKRSLFPGPQQFGRQWIDVDDGHLHAIGQHARGTGQSDAARSAGDDNGLNGHRVIMGKRAQPVTACNPAAWHPGCCRHR
jgi:hypothetical protein